MGLELRIIKDPCRDVPKPRFRTFGEQGGDIGRSPDRYWVLPDPKGYVSAQHCSIEYHDGAFWLRDMSRNGVFVNGSREPLGRGNAAQLRHGDRLRLAEYEVLVRLHPRQQEPVPMPVSPVAGPAATSERMESTGEHDVQVDEAASSERLNSALDHAVTKTLILGERSGSGPNGATGKEWPLDPRPPVAKDPAFPGVDTVEVRALEDPSPTVAPQASAAVGSAGVATDQFKPATLDHATMERNRVLLGVNDARALSAYKILRTRVRRRMLPNNWRSVGVCGAAEGAGKTLTAVNLALTFAQDRRSPCVLVDVDLHRPNVATYLGLQCDLGLTDYLVGQAEIGDILYSPGVAGLTIVPNVRPMQNASELLASPRMTELVKYLEALHPQRTIIFDLPPLLMSDDVLLFAPHMDCVLDVVAVGVTPRASLARSKEILAEFNVVGVVLNRATSQDKISHYYY